MSRRVMPALVLLALALSACRSTPKERAMETRLPIEYLEVVSPEVESTCAALARLHGVTFSAAAPELGGARTAPLAGGGVIGVRPPLRPDEAPVVRPYVLVKDIAAAVKEAEAAGGTIALPPMEIPGRGQCAIYFLGGIEHALWQKPAKP